MRPNVLLFAYVLLVQPEGIADRHKGEEPAGIIAEKPILSLPRTLNKPLLRLKLFMKTEKSIFEHTYINAVTGHATASLIRESKNSSGSTLT
jgi:hypothetical protein